MSSTSLSLSDIIGEAAASTVITDPFDGYELTPASNITPSAAASATPSTSESAKRAREDDDEEEDEDENRRSATPSATPVPSTSTTTGVGESAALHLVRQQVSAKRHCTESARELERYARATTGKADILMFSLLLQVRDSRVVGSGVTFSISSALKKNIRKYGIAALLTPNLSRYYKGPCVKVVLDIIKAHRFDLPPDIEKDRARWQLVESEVKEQLTSLKGTMKNTLGKSLSTAEEDAVDILTLGIALVGSSEIKLTVRHLARIAFLRAVLAERGVADTKYWPAVDKKLAKLREDAGKDKFKESQVFKRTLENDLAKYGHPTAEAGAAQSQLPAWQEDVERLFD